VYFIYFVPIFVFCNARLYSRRIKRLACVAFKRQFVSRVLNLPNSLSNNDGPVSTGDPPRDSLAKARRPDGQQTARESQLAGSAR
jgi:hypothetical protein